MKLRGRAIQLAALGALSFSADIGFGQSSSQYVGAADSLNDQHTIITQPVKLSYAPAPVASGKDSPLSGISLDSLHATHERPLFSASRRPPPPPVVAEAPKQDDTPPAPEKPSVTLVGVIYGTKLRIGIFANESDKSLFRAHLGETVLGWTVHDVDRRAVTLEKANERVKLELKLPIHDSETATMQQDPGVPLHGVPVGTIKPFATADRNK